MPAGDGKIATLFLQCIVLQAHVLSCISQTLKAWKHALYSTVHLCRVQQVQLILCNALCNVQYPLDLTQARSSHGLYAFYLYIWHSCSPANQKHSGLGKQLSALQTHCAENSKQIFPAMKLHVLFRNFYIHVSLSDLYITTFGNFYIHVSLSDLYITTFGPTILMQQNRWTDRGNI